MLDAAIADPQGQDSDAALLTLVETIEALSSTRTVEQVAEVVRSAARRISGADGVAFILRDGDQCWYLDEDAIGPLWKGGRFAMDRCISGWAMRRRRTAVIPDIYVDDRVPHEKYRQTFVKSLVMTPVRPADPIAAIGAYWATAHTPSPAVVAKLELMARAAATALENGRLNGELAEALERRTVLQSELDHRVKNTLAAVQSIASQTLRSARSSEEFADNFEARLMALSRAHELLSRQVWGRAQLSEILEAALLPFGGLDGPRITAAGPTIVIAPETAVALHMTVHELAVNAAQYGALSTPGGRVVIDWRIEGEAGARALVLAWREQGGPPVTAPTRRGFGSRLIERGLARDLGGAASLTFASDGVQFFLRVPLSARVALA
ncbi:MAG: histidine kinase [Caulobacter sp.]|nr:histidine kinase [Caulobacter sp.]